tara:strand:- start:975 stop:1400 length:426 start_codon:yes stop_codon:yes gene_type:complete
VQLGRFDELGSGILNVNKYIKAYSGKDNPKFIEGNTFKTIIPTPTVVNAATDVQGIEGVITKSIEGVTQGVKKRLLSIVSKIYTKHGIKAVELQETLEVSERTILSDIRRLEKYLDYKGNKKTGGYYLKSSVPESLDNVKK